MVFGNHAVVIGKLAFDQLGHELHTIKTEFGLIVCELHFDRPVSITEQPLHLDNSFPGKNHLLPRYFDVQGG